MNELIYYWLKGYPGLELLQRQQVDPVPGGCGLFFRGVTVKDRQQNLLGQGAGWKTLHFRLARYGDRADSPPFLMTLEAWARQNAAAGTAARKNPRCVRDTDSGLCLWEAELEVTYWEENV